MIKHSRVLNWVPDLPDHRDYKYEAHSEYRSMVGVAALPLAKDLRSGQSPVVDQGQIGSCTGNAIAAGLEQLQIFEIQKNFPLSQAPEEFDKGKFEAISRSFIYVNEKIIEQYPLDQDNGAQIRDGILSVRKYGLCRETIWPYSDHNCTVKPSSGAYAEAAAHKDLYAYRIDNTNLLSMKTCLANGSGFVFGISVYSSFMSQDVSNTGMVPYPSSNEVLEGGHAIFCVGYNDHTQRFIVKNSWGSGWGNMGYCFIPYQYFLNPDLCSDCWTLRRVACVV